MVGVGGIPSQSEQLSVDKSEQNWVVNLLGDSIEVLKVDTEMGEPSFSLENRTGAPLAGQVWCQMVDRYGCTVGLSLLQFQV